jgi:hypothetical protein
MARIQDTGTAVQGAWGCGSAMTTKRAATHIPLRIIHAQNSSPWIRFILIARLSIDEHAVVHPLAPAALSGS